MRVLIINGSPRPSGNSAMLIRHMSGVFSSLGVETEVMDIGAKDIRGCIACRRCIELGRCVFNDAVNEAMEKFERCDGLIVVSPVYFASPNGNLISFLDRLFHGSSFSKRYKVGAAFVIARRGGTGTAFDVLNKYFTISGMPVVSGDYWNNGFGGAEGEIEQDKEGLRNARVVAKRMTFLMKAIADAKSAYPELLEEEPAVRTNFI